MSWCGRNTAKDGKLPDYDMPALIAGMPVPIASKRFERDQNSKNNVSRVSAVPHITLDFQTQMVLQSDGSYARV
jgi:hypothetical protein